VFWLVSFENAPEIHDDIIDALELSQFINTSLPLYFIVSALTLYGSPSTIDTLSK